MRRTLKQTEKNEKNFLEEISVKNTIVKELENKIHRTNSENQYVYGEYERELELHKDEKTQLARKVAGLENDLEGYHKFLLKILTLFRKQEVIIGN